MRSIKSYESMIVDILSPKERRKKHYILSAAVWVAAMGYFVDVYDLLLFSIVRVPILKSLGFTGQILTDQGIFLLNIR